MEAQMNSAFASQPTAFAAVQLSSAGRCISEHDPDWGGATITAETAEKGAHYVSTEEVLFPRSMDVAWVHVPKMKAGDRGLWLLHSGDLRGEAVPGHAIVHLLDFQPASQIKCVRSFLKGVDRQ